ncbi:MAG: HRDC domain-containing protein [Deltaproteobacteria bacterium]|jgi:ribonuclease D|nr:HRDC domain-containing protein [Deltaproteobacteria bacterium]
MATEAVVIETPAALAELAEKLRQAPAVAVDLEADSMYHFQEKVCLIQMATSQSSMVIDPLRIQNLESLRPVFANPTIEKIFHGADYDVRSLFRDFGIEIANLLDTQVACKFLGLKETSLEAVLQARFGVTLNKKYQRKDWSRRPLPDEMIVYAADDVRYLLPLANMLVGELKDKGRLAWVKEECDLLSRVRSHQNNHQPLFLQFKGAGRLNLRSLAVLEALLHLRRRVAAKKDRPLFKVFSNKALLQLAVQKPANTKQLSESGALSSKQLVMYGEELVEAIHHAQQIPADELPIYPRLKNRAVHPAVPDRIKALKNWRDKKAAALDIEPTVLLNKGVMAALAAEKPVKPQALDAVKELKQWQKTEFGAEIVGVLKRVR